MRRVLRDQLAAPRYEVLPLAGVVDDVVAYLPPGATVTVTASPAQGPEATVTVAEVLAQRGFRAVPHLSARQVGPEAVPTVMDRLQTAGVKDVFIIGGDDHRPHTQPTTIQPTQMRSRQTYSGHPGTGHSDAGFADGEALLTAVRREDAALNIGVPGYPEGHPVIPDQTLDESLHRKLEHADCVVGQLCFDAAAVHSWAQRLNSITAVPVYAGVAGAVSSTRLLRIASRIGVGDSLRFLKNGGVELARRLVSPGRYDPSVLLGDLAKSGLNAGTTEAECRRADHTQAHLPPGTNPIRDKTYSWSEGVPITGLHLYTFNAVKQTEQWRQELLAQLEEGDSP